MTSILRHNRLALLGGGVLLLMVAISVAASWIASMDPAMMQPRMRLTPPGEAFLLGTDALRARRVLPRRAWQPHVPGHRRAGGRHHDCDRHPHRPGGRGLAHHGPRPHADHGRRHGHSGILLAVALVSLFGASLASVVIAIAVPEIPRVVRLVRSVVLSVREEPYVEAAVGLGVPYPKVVWRHILPNCFAPLIVQASYVFAAAILLEAVLGFLGVGFPPEIPTFGNILAEARPVFQRAPWITVAPGLLLAVTVLAVNLLGDGLRDSLDPKLARRAND